MNDDIRTVLLSVLLLNFSSRDAYTMFNLCQYESSGFEHLQYCVVSSN